MSDLFVVARMFACSTARSLECILVVTREKDELANAKLQQMVSGQNEAERRKGEAETISQDLEQQNKRIAERRHQVCMYGGGAPAKFLR